MGYPQHVGFLCAVGLVGVIYGSAPTLAVAQVRISGLAEMKVVEVREEGGQLLLRSDDGRLFSVPLDRVDGLAGLSVEEINRSLRTDSSDVTVAEILDLLGAGISEKTITAYVQKRGARFDLSAVHLLELKRAGATERFLQFLIRAGGKGRFLPSYNGPRRQVRQETITADRFSDPSYAEPVPEGIPYYPYVYPGYTSYVGYAPYFASHTVRATRARSPRSRSKVQHHRRARSVAQRPSGSFRRSGRSARAGAPRPHPLRLSTSRLTRPSTPRRTMSAPMSPMRTTGPIRTGGSRGRRR